MDKVTTTTVASSTVSTTHPVLSGSSLAALVGVLLFLALLVIISPSILSLLYNKRRPVNGTGATGAPSSFFQINYITWYVLHSTVAALVIIGVIILALDGVIDAAVVSALLGSLLGYVLGTASQHATPQSGSGPAASGQTQASLPPGSVPQGRGQTS